MRRYVCIYERIYRSNECGNRNTLSECKFGAVVVVRDLSWRREEGVVQELSFISIPHPVKKRTSTTLPCSCGPYSISNDVLWDVARDCCLINYPRKKRLANQGRTMGIVDVGIGGCSRICSNHEHLQ